MAAGLVALVALAPGIRAVELDPTFGDRGVVRDGRLHVSAIAVQLDGRTLAAGSWMGAPVVTRYTRNGLSDDSFGIGGSVTPPFPDPTSLEALVQQADGRIMLAGSASTSNGFKFLVARLLSSGELDSTFGGTGFVTTAFAGDRAHAQAIALQPDGKVVVAGGAGPAVPIPIFDYAAARYNPDGSLDSTFGSGGRVLVDLGAGLPEMAQDLVVEADGRIVLAGITGSSSGSGCGILGLLADGSLDPSFGVAGMLFLTAGISTDCSALALQSDGRIVVAGGSYQPTGALVVRLYPDGSFDTSFGSGGLTTIPGLGPARGVAIDPTGRIALAAEDYVFARLLPNGTPDRSVGPEGWISPGLGGNPPHFQAHATSIALGPGSAAVLAGDQTFVVITHAALVRYIDDDFETIPTLSETGTILLAALLGLAGLLAIRRAA